MNTTVLAVILLGVISLVAFWLWIDYKASKNVIDYMVVHFPVPTYKVTYHNNTPTSTIGLEVKPLKEGVTRVYRKNNRRKRK